MRIAAFAVNYLMVPAKNTGNGFRIADIKGASPAWRLLGNDLDWAHIALLTRM